MAKGKTAAKAKPKKAVKASALKTPIEGDSTALADLKTQRRLLLKKLESRGISARDLATVSAELRKVNATISVVENAGKNEGVAEEELAARASTVVAMLMKTKAERDRLKLALVEPPADDTADEDDTEEDEATG